MLLMFREERLPSKNLSLAVSEGFDGERSMKMETWKRYHIRIVNIVPPFYYRGNTPLTFRL